MKFRKLAVLSLCLVLMLSFASCGKNDDSQGEKGNINTSQNDDADKSEEKNDDVLGDYIFEHIENDTGVRYDLLKDGYGHIAIPYPKESEVTRQASNQVKIYNKQMDVTFFIEYVFVYPDSTDEGADESSRMSPDKLTDLFHWQLNTQSFDIEGFTYQRGVDQYSSKEEGLKEINTDNLMRIRSDYKELHTVSSDGTNDYRLASERRYYIYKDNMCACISAIGEQIDFQYTKEMIDYMVSNMRVYDEDLERSTVPVSIGQDKINISSLFEEQSDVIMQYINAGGVMYKVPDNKGSTMSGAFLSVDLIDDNKYSFDENTIDNNEMFLRAYPDLREVTENNDLPFRYEQDQEQFSVLYPLKAYFEKKGYEVSDLFGSYLSIYRTDSYGSYLIEHGDTWNIDEFMITKNGESYIVTFGYPDVKYDDAIKVINNIVD